MANKYRIFEALDIINQEDIKNKTALVGVCNQVQAMTKCTGGSLITMGAPEQALWDIQEERSRAFLVIVDVNAYNDLQNPPEPVYEPRVLIDVDLHSYDLTEVQRDLQMRLRAQGDVLMSFMYSALPDDFTEVNKLLKSEAGVKSLKVIRIKDRTLDIFIELLDKSSYNLTKNF